MKERPYLHYLTKALALGALVGSGIVATKEIKPLIQRIEPQSTSSGNQIIVPFFPYTVTDSYSTQVCVSNKPGRVLPPFIIPYTP